jgi:two-component system, NtrC family, response regulator HydG
MKNRILVVDDEEHVRVAFQTFLEEEGCEVAVADSYDAALRSLKSSRFDAVVSDIIMGQKTGIDLLREIKQKGLRCPVVMITGAPDIQTATSAVRLGAFDYISKPVTQEILLRAVRLALRHKALDDEREGYLRNLEAIFASVQDGVVSVDDAMVITHANEAIEYFTLFRPEQLPGKTIREAVKPSFSSCIEVLEKTIQTREPVREFRTEAAGSDGRPMVVVINCSPLIDRDGTFMGSVLVLRDISRITNLERELQERQFFHKIVGKSVIMQDIYTRIEALAETDTTVLITGGSGTGKELVAEAIHYSGSRALKPLVKFNCTAFAENLLESELFGHVAGAFTGAIKDKVGRFQMAHEGTIFLDEIGDMAPSLQLKLLRVLQEHEFERVGDTKPIKVDIRVIAATNCDLLEKMRQGSFREDLYYRLNVMEMNLPSLAQRIEDIPLLVGHFCAKFNKKFKKDVKGVSDQVMRLFVNYQWPGNVRELENVIERAFILCNTDTITTDHISLQLKDASGIENGVEESECALDYDQILNALKQTRWNRSKAAELLGTSRRTFYRKLKDLHLLENK